MRALVVDDSRTIRMMLSRILGDCGFEVSEAQHGREALDYLDAHPETALALIDWSMPEMDGLELLEALRSDSRFRNVRRIMVTTETGKGQVERAVSAGADEYVMKPFTRAVIEEKLRLVGLAA